MRLSEASRPAPPGRRASTGGGEALCDNGERTAHLSGVAQWHVANEPGGVSLVEVEEVAHHAMQRTT